MVNDAASISINDKNWFVGSIQYYGIGCLLPNTMDREKLLLEVADIIGEERSKVVMVVFS